MKTENNNKVPSEYYILVWNMDMDESEYILGESLLLRRIPLKISVFDLAAVGAVGFREWAILEPMADNLTAEIVSPQDAVRLPGYDALNKGWLASVLFVLRGFANHMCPAVSTYSWSMVAGHQKSTSKAFQEQLREEGVQHAVYNRCRSLPPFKGGLLDYHTHIWVPKSIMTKTFTTSDAEWIKKNYSTFNKMASESERFKFALEAAVDWRFAKEKRSAIARIWSGIESIFEINAELSFRIPLYASTIMADRGKERLKAFERVKKLYNIRSKAVHGAPIKDSELDIGIEGSFSLLRDLILKSVELENVPSSQDFLHELLM